MKQGAPVLLSLWAIALLSSCAEQAQQNESELDTIKPAQSASEVGRSYTFQVDIDSETAEPTITFPDGTVTHSYEAYAQAVYAISAENPNSDIQVELGEQFSRRLDTELGLNPQEADTGSSEAPPPWVVPVGSYTLSGGGNYGYVSCLKQTGNYYAVRLNRGSSQVFDFHFMKYMSGASTCLGAYESVIWKTCWSTCSDPSGNVYDAIYAAAIAASLSYISSVAIEYIAAPLTVSALAL